jgi:hypothetical protein
MEALARLVIGANCSELGELVLSTLESLIETIPDGRGKRGNIFPPLPEIVPGQRHPESEAQSDMRATLSQLRRESHRVRSDASSSDRPFKLQTLKEGVWSRWKWRDGSKQPLLKFPGSMHNEALQRLEKLESSRATELARPDDPAAIAELLKGWSDPKVVSARDLLRSLGPNADPSGRDAVCSAIESLAGGQVSYYEFPLLAGILVHLGAYRRALNVSSSRENNEQSGDIWLAITRRSLAEGRETAMPVLDEVARLKERLWATEQKGRVAAGLAYAFQVLGQVPRAWELVRDIEYQNIRIDAAAYLLWHLKEHHQRNAVFECCAQLRDLVNDTWSDGDKAAGLVVLSAAAAWAGHDDLCASALSELVQSWEAHPRLERGEYRDFQMVLGSGLPFVPGSRGYVEHWLAAFVETNRASVALETLHRMPFALNPLIALSVMAAEAAEIGAVDLYRDLLRLYRDAQEVAPEPTSVWYETRSIELLAPSLPQSANRERAYRWLRTALLAARFEGRNEVWRHIHDFAPLLDAFPPGTGVRVRDRLLVIERLHTQNAAGGE